MSKLVKVEAISHTDVRGKELLYVKIEDLVINVGKATYEAVKAITDPVTKMQIAEPLKQEGGK